MYFRVNGCYEALQSGKASEGLLDLTGGLTEVYYPPQMNGPELFNVIRQALRNGAFVACNTVSKYGLNQVVRVVVVVPQQKLKPIRNRPKFVQSQFQLQ